MSVTPLKAETTTASLLSFAFWLTIWITFWIFWALATDVPPNFNTIMIFVICCKLYDVSYEL